MNAVVNQATMLRAKGRKRDANALCDYQLITFVVAPSIEISCAQD